MVRVSVSPNRNRNHNPKTSFFKNIVDPDLDPYPGPAFY